MAKNMQAFDDAIQLIATFDTECENRLKASSVPQADIDRVFGALIPLLQEASEMCLTARLEYREKHPHRPRKRA